MCISRSYQWMKVTYGSDRNSPDQCLEVQFQDQQKIATGPDQWSSLLIFENERLQKDQSMWTVQDWLRPVLCIPKKKPLKQAQEHINQTKTDNDMAKTAKFYRKQYMYLNIL